MGFQTVLKFRAAAVLLAIAACVFACRPRPAAAQDGLGGILADKLRERLRGKPGPSKVGTTVNLAGLKVSVWRPAKATLPASGRAPLVIFSHGFHGISTQSTFLTSALAENGYLVLAPNHKDSIVARPGADWRPEVGFGKPGQWSEKTYRDRADDIIALVKALKTEQPWPEMIDWSRFALAGHSLGGYTVLGLAGGWPSWKLPEVRAVLALSPYCSPYTQQHSLAALGMPVMYQGGTRDIGITPFVKHGGGAYDQTASPAYFVDFEKAGHFAWTDLVTDHQANIKYYSLAFLNKYLKGDATADPTHTQPGVAELRSK
jgi:predicted dienelactone hydrolase